MSQQVLVPSVSHSALAAAAYLQEAVDGLKYVGVESALAYQPLALDGKPKDVYTMHTMERRLGFYDGPSQNKESGIKSHGLGHMPVRVRDGGLDIAIQRVLVGEDLVNHSGTDQMGILAQYRLDAKHPIGSDGGIPPGADLVLAALTKSVDHIYEVARNPGKAPVKLHLPNVWATWHTAEEGECPPFVARRLGDIIFRFLRTKRMLRCMRAPFSGKVVEVLDDGSKAKALMIDVLGTGERVHLAIPVLFQLVPLIEGTILEKDAPLVIPESAWALGSSHSCYMQLLANHPAGATDLVDCEIEAAQVWEAPKEFSLPLELALIMDDFPDICREYPVWGPQVVLGDGNTLKNFWDLSCFERPARQQAPAAKKPASYATRR